jgi:hypothetical protein
MEDQPDRVQLLFLEQPEERTYFDHPEIPRTVPVKTQDPIEPPDSSSPPSLTGSLSTVSTVSSRSRYGDSDASSRTSATVTVASTVIAPPWDEPTLDQQLMTLPYYGYDLPCEFGFIGCRERFHPLHLDSWISHTLSHFPPDIPPPSRAICIFCDTEFDCAQRGIDAAANWHERMLHIGSHLQARESPDSVRPDFFVINHMRANGLSSRADYTYANKFTERPYCPGLVPLGYETAEMKMKKERDLQEYHDLDKEKRLLRRENRTHKGRSRATLESSTARMQR